jgi:hypothetical protein
MEIIFGFIVMAITIKVIRCIERIIAQSNNPIVHFLVMAAGTAAAISLARDVVRWSKKDEK